VPSLADLATAAGTEEGRETLKGFLEGGIGVGVCEFWEEEWVVE